MNSTAQHHVCAVLEAIQGPTPTSWCAHFVAQQLPDAHVIVIARRKEFSL